VADTGERGPVTRLGTLKPTPPYDPMSDGLQWLVNDEVGSEYTTLAQLFDGNAANGEAADGDVIIPLGQAEV